jgi:hypothetical protein
MFRGLPVCWSVLKRITPPRPRSAMSAAVVPAASIVRPRNPTSSSRAIFVSSGIAGVDDAVGGGDALGGGGDDDAGGEVGLGDTRGVRDGVADGAPQAASAAASPARAPP